MIKKLTIFLVADMATRTSIDFYRQIALVNSQVQPYNRQIDRWNEEVNSFLDRNPEQVDVIDARLTQISAEEATLKERARTQLQFVPQKIASFDEFISQFIGQWEQVMRDDHFQDPAHRFFFLVIDLHSKSSFRDFDPKELEPAFNELSEQDRRVISSWFPETRSPDDASIFTGMRSEELLLLRQRLETVFLHEKVSRLSPPQFQILTHVLEMKARKEGVLIASGDSHWASNHLYDSPLRLFSALSQVLLMKRNETVFGLWKELYRIGTGKLASKLLSQCPLLDELRRGIKLDVREEIREELFARIRYLMQFQNLMTRLEQKYLNWNYIFRNHTEELSRGFEEKLLQVILSPVRLFGEDRVSSLVSSLNSYLAIVDDLSRIVDLPEKDAKYLLNIINRQYAMRPGHSVVQNEEGLVHLLTKAKTALRTKQLHPEEGIVRQKPEQYQSIFLLRDENVVQGKFKPMPSSSVGREAIGESLNCLLGTDFAPAARGVWLSIRNELLDISFFLETDRLDEAKRKFDLLDQSFQHQIYYHLFKLKKPVNPPHNYGELAWNGHPEYPTTNEERILAIRGYLDSKLPLKDVYEKFERGSISEANKQFNLLNVELKNIVYKHLINVKGLAWAWNGHKEPVTDDDRRRAVKLALEETDSFDQFVVSRHPKWFHLMGTLQKWVPNCQEGTDLLYKDDRAGRMLKGLSIPMVQMYNILALIKGSGDCHSGNTLFQFGSNAQIENLIDCDDEFIMPKVNHYHHIQIWTLGLPQASKPLLRPILRMLAAPEFLNKWINLKLANDSIASNPRIDAFKNRIHTINRLCKEELEKPMITLTCQDLYFALYGGREKFLRLKEQEHHRPEFILFQYFMKKDMTQYLDEIAMRGEIFTANARTLYS